MSNFYFYYHDHTYIITKLTIVCIDMYLGIVIAINTIIKLLISIIIILTIATYINL